MRLFVFIFISLIFSCFVIIIIYSGLNPFVSTSKPNIDSYFKLEQKILKPHCECHREYLILDKHSALGYVSVDQYSTKSNQRINLLNLTLSELATFNVACDLYNVFKRGRNQKIASYSLYGTDQKYYSKIEKVLEQIKHLYPGYFVRVYYDSTVNQTFRCYLECKYPNLVDFCDVNHFIPDLKRLNQENNSMDLKYMHKMMWRFLPIGDTFVKWFISRDSDSFITKREVDAVDEWLNSGNIGHIMRDNEGHGTEILGGLWGFRNHLDRKLSKRLFDVVSSPKIGAKYNSNGQSPKGNDQFFLSNYIYHQIVDKSAVHDSYLCDKYLNSRPFPSKREGGAYVGNLEEQEGPPKPCPIQCRPVDHTDWIYC